MTVSVSLRRAFVVVPCLVAIGLISGCGDEASTSSAPPTAAGAAAPPPKPTPANNAANQSSNAGNDSTLNPSLKK